MPLDHVDVLIVGAGLSGNWPEDLDWAGKRVVVIGSGSTAVTMVPAIATRAEHVTMVQRSPTYVLSIPARDVVANTLRRLPGDLLLMRRGRLDDAGIRFTRASTPVRQSHSAASRRPG
jgi:cation diffusion facilitator CzcD-associated flavoprotein CzcO